MPKRPKVATERRDAGSFYARDALQRAALAEALGVRGLDQEIALLRLMLRELRDDATADASDVMEIVKLLVRAVAAAGRLPADDTDDILAEVTAQLRGIIGLLADPPE